MKKLLLTLSVALTALCASAAAEWHLVTADDVLSAGDKIILVESGNALSTTQNNNNRGQVAVTANNGVISTISSDVQVITLADSGNNSKNWMLDVTATGATTNSYLYASSNSNNYLKTTTTKTSTGAYWSISIDQENKATILSNQANKTQTSSYYYIGRNSSNSTFGAYIQGQAKPQIYRLEEANEGPKTYTPAWAGSSIEIELDADHQLVLGDSHPDILFESNDEDVVMVDDETGYIMAAGIGTTTITAMWAGEGWNEGETTISVTVTKKAPGISFPEKNYKMNIGEIFASPLVNPNDLPISWSISDTSIASIDDEGNVQAFAAGETSVRATFTTDDTYKGSWVAYTLTIEDPYRPVGTTVTDALTAQNFNVIGNSYASATEPYTYTSTTSGAEWSGVLNGVYASGESQTAQAKYFGLKDVGITCTKSAGNVSKIEAKLYSSQSFSGSRNLTIKGSNDGTTWTDVKTLSISTSTKDYDYTFTENYSLIKIVGTSSALQFEYINVTWQPEPFECEPVITNQYGEEFIADQVVPTAHNDATCTDDFTFSVDLGSEATDLKAYYHLEETHALSVLAIDPNYWTLLPDGEKISVPAAFTGSLKLYAASAAGAVSSVYTFPLNGDIKTAVEAIEADAAATAEYFNLQGQRVAQPAAGLYIVRRGNTITKEIVK